MTEEQILECTIVVLEFLNDDTDKELRSFNDDPSFIRMNETFKENNFNNSMVDFCIFINEKYNFYTGKLWLKDGREFFADDYLQPGPSKAKIMLRTIVRDLKLNEILC